MVLSDGRATRSQPFPCPISALSPRAPQSARPWRTLLVALLALSAMALARPVRAGAPEDPLAAAKKLFDKGQTAQAAAVLAEAVKREPADERFWGLLGRVKARLGDRAGALEAYRLALRLSPADSLTRMRLDMIGDLAPEANPSRGPASGRDDSSGRSGRSGRSERPPSALERAALEELGRAAADPGHLGCGAPALAVLDPLWTAGPVQAAQAAGPLQPGEDPALEL
ncbi:MAG: hypothetical protein HQK81_10065, partial [Desulfovibrionaceae bacterium]|nr:hypothetical protein [Desulfovibrionaceae bacterium]